MCLACDQFILTIEQVPTVVRLSLSSSMKRSPSLSLSPRISNLGMYYYYYSLHIDFVGFYHMGSIWCNTYNKINI